MNLRALPAGLAPAVLGALLGLPAATAQAQILFPKAIDYAIRAQTSVQSNSNPSRVSAGRGSAQSSTAVVHTVGAALRIPILSEETRLDVSGVIGDARYQETPALNHHPEKLDTTFHWRAGRLFSGQTGYHYQKRRYESDRVWPGSDTVATRRLESEVALHASDSLTLPTVKIFKEETRYDTQVNQQLFDRNMQGWEVSARYQSPSGSSVRAGMEHSTTRYPQRAQTGRTNLDDEYRDQELFTDIFWLYSPKTSFYARTGWLDRRYQNLSIRNTRFFTLNTRVSWQYSAKTTLHLGLWQTPYNNDEDPDVVYATLRGTSLTADWRPTPKLTVGLQTSYQQQRDHHTAGDDRDSTRLHYGSRLSWRLNRNVNVILDGFRVQQRSDDPWNRYQQNIVRLGLNLSTDSGNPQVAPLLRPVECNWTYVETELCP